MCTAISYKTKDHYFGRNLDLEYNYEEAVVITPRNYSFHFRKENIMKHHLAIIGIAYVYKDVPLYYEGVNESGLGMAGLSFPGNAVYQDEKIGMHNIATYEFIPWILGQCKNVREVRDILKKTNLTKLAVDATLPITPLHFMISDKDESIVVEPMEDGLHVIGNPVKVLTNNPPFTYQLWQLNNYQKISKKQPRNMFARELQLECDSRGMGGIGLPGDLSSSSRFVRAAFTKWNSVGGENEEENVSQFFHILGSVEQQKGCVQLDSDAYEYTVYSSCCNTDKGIYYYKTYHNSTITAVSMHRENLNGDKLVVYPLEWEQNIIWKN